MRKNHRLFATTFENHVLMFIKEYHLLESGKKLALAASAGVDSLSLARILYEAKVPFELLHFNHGTRPLENRLEAELIQKLGESYKAPVKMIEGSFSLTQKNFEHAARLWRKSHYQKLIANNYFIFTAHHLDDSYEWSLMQASKQGSLKSTLGIPVKALGIRRPLMCVSKKQILRYARARKLEWIEDSSNQNENFERNYLRLNITSRLKEKYPRLLRHYVAQKNELAQILGVHALGEQSLEFHLEVDESGGLCFSGHSMLPHKARIKEALKFYSSKTRGEIDYELDKLIAAHADLQKNLKQLRFKGPMSFSGGVEVYLCHEDLFIIGQKQKDFYQEMDEKFVQYLESKAQIPFSVTKCYPHLVIGKNILVKNSMQFVHSLLPKTCAWLKNKKVPYTFAPVLKKEITQKLLQSAVVLASSDLGI
jgi:tRNA(Ile)-lysidine synthase